MVKKCLKIGDHVGIARIDEDRGDIQEALSYLNSQRQYEEAISLLHRHPTFEPFESCKLLVLSKKAAKQCYARSDLLAMMKYVEMSPLLSEKVSYDIIFVCSLANIFYIN